MADLREARVALLHDWLVRMRGGEKVLESLHEIFPEAPIYTLMCDRKRLSPALSQADIRTSFLQFVPGIRFYYRWLLPIFPWVVQLFDLSRHDLVISSSHCVAKGCRVARHTLHISYCHTPMRYAWEMEDEYFSRVPPFVRQIVHGLMKSLRNWDCETSRTVHHFIANSENTRQRIQRYYARDAEVIHPPVDTEFFRSNGKAVAEEFYLIVSALVPYKRIDLAIGAFNQMGRPLVIIGEGPCLRSLRRLARSNIKLLGWRNDQNLRDYYARCRALIFPGEEDFGIVPVEAQAAGKPVIAFAKGGVLESVTVETGVFFKEPTVSNLMEAIQRFESLRFDPELIRNHAATFDGKFFKKKAKDYIEGLYVSWCEKGRGA